MAGALLHPQGLQTLLFQGVRSPPAKKTFPDDASFCFFVTGSSCIQNILPRYPVSVMALSPGPSHYFSCRRYRAAEHSRAPACREPEYSGKKVVAKGIIHITPQTEIRCTQPSAAASAQDRVESGTLPTRPRVSFMPARVHFILVHMVLFELCKKSSDRVRNRR